MLLAGLILVARPAFLYNPRPRAQGDPAHNGYQFSVNKVHHRLAQSGGSVLSFEVPPSWVTLPELTKAPRHMGSKALNPDLHPQNHL